MLLNQPGQSMCMVMYMPARTPIRSLAYASDIEDTGWIDCEYGSGFERYSDAHAGLQVRREGSDVKLRGCVRCLQNTPSGSDGEVIIGYLPEGFAPSDYVNTICQGSGMNRFHVTY